MAVGLAIIVLAACTYNYNLPPASEMEASGSTFVMTLPRAHWVGGTGCGGRSVSKAWLHNIGTVLDSMEFCFVDPSLSPYMEQWKLSAYAAELPRDSLAAPESMRAEIRVDSLLMPAGLMMAKGSGKNRDTLVVDAGGAKYVWTCLKWTDYVGNIGWAAVLLRPPMVYSVQSQDCPCQPGDAYSVLQSFRPRP